MGALGLLTIEQLQSRSNSDIVKNTDEGILEYYIDVAEALLYDQGLDTTRTYYAMNVGYAVLKLTEFLVLSDQEHFLLVHAGPFEQEKMGSYSYKIKQIEQQGWPPMVEKIIKMYRLLGEPEKLFFSTRVFPEFKADETTSFREYHDLMDSEFYDEETEVP